jgi:hypothetical protein
MKHVQRIRNITLTSAALVLAACGTGFRAGPTGLLNGPTGDFADVQSNGITIGAHGEAGLALLSVTGDLGLTRFSGKEVNGVDTDAATLWEVAAGARYFSGPLFFGAQVGAISGGDLSDEGLFRPELGVRFGKLDLLARYKLGGDAQWWSLGGSYSIW